MFLEIEIGEIFDVPFGEQHVCKTAVIVFRHAYIRHDSTAVIHFSSTRSGVFADQRVWNSPYTTILCPMRIVEYLNTASAGSVIFGRSQLQERVETYRTGVLNQTLAKGALSD